MKGSIKLSLAIALALGGADAYALGLGTIQVKSGLNQPLVAEIPVLQSAPGEAEGLLVQLASAEDFDRVGLSRARLAVPLEFSLGKDGKGDPVIRITSKDIVREPVVDFLVEANWAKGRLLREYTVLLDPPVMAPAVKGSSAVAVATKEPERAPAQALPDTKPVAKPVAKPAPSAPVAEAPPPKAKPTAAPPSAPRAAAGGEYGPVASGETLSEIARSTRPDEGVSVDQMMLALLKSNPNAFYKDNINALKRGAILRIPSADEVKSSASMRDAAAQVRAQVDEWRGGAATSTPTLIADTAPTATTKPTTAAGSKTKPNERLELVPPRAGKDSQASADRIGSGKGAATGAANGADLKAELQRTKEALTSREQESGELKSRVHELEDLKGKNDKLITLKDSEIAELQRKLRELQDQSKAAKTATTTAAVPPVTTTSPAATTTPSTTASTTTPAATTPKTPDADKKLSKEDIWGDVSGAGTKTTPPGTTATPPGGTMSPTPSSTTASTTTPSSTTPSATSPSSTVPSASTTTPPSTTATPSSTAPSATSTMTPSPTAMTPVGSTPPSSTASTGTTTPTSTTTPLSTPAPATTAGTSSSTTPTTTPKPAPKIVPTPAPAEPWFRTLPSWALPAVGGVGLLLVLLGVMSMRRRKAAAVIVPTRPSIAGSFGDSPLAGGDVADLPISAEEEALIDQVRQTPSDPALHLELLSLYYAERNVPKFEVAAEEMYAHIADPNQPEWQQAKAMGQELASHNPLFWSGEEGEIHHHADGSVAHGGEPDFAFDDGTYSRTAATFEDEHTREVALDDFAAADIPTPAHVAPDRDFDFDLTDHAATGAAPMAPGMATPEAHHVKDEGFSFDLPPIDFAHEATTNLNLEPVAAPPTPARAAAAADDEFFAGEDAIGTKLDLAKAYLDMGDPEGARSMLEEVMAEGSDAQKVEARKLMADIR